jgi:hypothetical protein
VELDYAWIEWWATVLDIVAALVAGLAWLWAAQTRLPHFPAVGPDSPPDVWQPVEMALRASAMRNALAAWCACAAALTGVLGFLAHLAQLPH